jgi:hypothetical protein
LVWISQIYLRNLAGTRASTDDRLLSKSFKTDFQEFYYLFVALKFFDLGGLFASLDLI